MKLRILIRLFMVLLIIFQSGNVMPVNRNSIFNITVRISNFKNNTGKAGINLYHASPGFPSDPFKAMKVEFVSINDKKAEITFSNLEAGYYAISAFHDENDNGRLETTWYGAPKEGVGVSNNIKGGLGAPKFDEAKFFVKNTEVIIPIALYYL